MTHACVPPRIMLRTFARHSCCSGQSMRCVGSLRDDVVGVHGELDHVPEFRVGRVRGLLLGTALGDALGLPMEGLSEDIVRRRFGERLTRFLLLGRTGFVSDDTEQSALLCQSLIRGRNVPERMRVEFCGALVGWFWRLPFGVGLAALRACLRLTLGFSSGVRSAGNGALMRAPILGAAPGLGAPERNKLAASMAELTHTHPWAVQACQVAADLAHRCLTAEVTADRARLARDALLAVPDDELSQRALMAVELAECQKPYSTRTWGNTGFVLHSLPLTLYSFVRWGAEPLRAIQETILLGGDTDTHAAIVGAWCGALHGEEALPLVWIDDIQDGPFGPTHLRALADALAGGECAPRYSRPRAMFRNLMLYPVIIGHGFGRVALGLKDLAARLAPGRGAPPR